MRAVNQNSQNTSATADSNIIQQELEILQKFLQESPSEAIREATDYITQRANLNIEKIKNTAQAHLIPHFEQLLGRVTSNSGVPIMYIPQDLQEQFTLNGKIPTLNWYIDERAHTPLVNTAEIYEKTFEALDNKTFEYYGHDVWSFYDAFTDYPLDGKTVVIFGLAGCNCEAIAVWKNAKKVYVVDYNKPICQHEKIEVLTHDELSKSGLKFDIGISFSSFEHDGLGRYGDPVSPDGDLNAMNYAKSLIKEDGLLFLGVPMGKDCLVWNVHRIYGEIRYPLLIKGWLCLDAYHIKGTKVFDSALGTWAHVQPLVVLKNVQSVSENDISERINHAKNLQSQRNNATRDGALLEKILLMTKGG